MTTQLHSIHPVGAKEFPKGTTLELSLGTIPGHVHVLLQLPRTSRAVDLGDIPVRNGEVDISCPFVFVSYAREDQQRALRIARKLRDEGILVWIDHEELLPGDRWQERIDTQIEVADRVILLLSKRSCSKTGEVQRELKYALRESERRPISARYLVPVLLEEVEVPRSLREYHWLRYDEPGAHARLVKALREELVDRST